MCIKTSLSAFTCMAIRERDVAMHQQGPAMGDCGITMHWQ